MSKVSIIIPVYNTEKYLKRCLDSVINQTLKDIEIICINDCSTDNSLKILKEYAKSDNRIKIIDFRENKGVAVARNEAMKIAKGEYIGFLDSDDYIDLDFYEKLYNKAKENNSDLVIGNWYWVGSNNNNNIFDIVELVKINKFNYNQAFTLGLYKKELLKQYNIKFIEKCSFGEDRIVPLMASYYSKNFSIVEDTFYYYYRANTNSATISKMTTKKTNDFLYSLNIIFSFINKINISEENYKVVADAFIDTAYLISYAMDDEVKKDYIIKLCAGFQDLKYYDDLKKLFCIDNIKQINCYITKICNKKIFDNLRKNLKVKEGAKC